MSEVKLDKLSQFLPEFYFDFVARIVPGLLVCAAYAWDQLDQFQSFGGIGLGLVGSYFVGFIADVISDKLLGRPLHHLFAVVSRLAGSPPALLDNVLWSQIAELKESAAALAKKKMAEKAMVRSAILLNSIVLIFPPTLVDRWFSVASLLILLACHLAVHANLSGGFANVED